MQRSKIPGISRREFFCARLPQFLQFSAVRESCQKLHKPSRLGALFSAGRGPGELAIDAVPPGHDVTVHVLG